MTCTARVTLAILLALPLAFAAPAALDLDPAFAAFGGKVKNIRIRERSNSQGYRVVVVAEDDEDKEVDAVEVHFLGFDDGEPRPDTLPVPSPITFIAPNTEPDVKKRKKDQRFRYDDLQFNRGNPVGLTYSVLVTMLDARGEALAPPDAFDVVVAPANVAVQVDFVPTGRGTSAYTGAVLVVPSAAGSFQELFAASDQARTHTAVVTTIDSIDPDDPARAFGTFDGAGAIVSLEVAEGILLTFGGASEEEASEFSVKGGAWPEPMRQNGSGTRRAVTNVGSRPSLL